MILDEIKDIPIKKYFIGSDYTASLNTLQIMKKVIHESAKNPYVRRYAEYITDSVSCCKFSQMDTILTFVQEHVKYISNPRYYQYIKTPSVLLKQIDQNLPTAGACSDLTILLLSLLESIGFKTAIIAVSYEPSKKLQHVYGIAKNQSQWYPMDPTNSSAPVGWQRAGITHRKIVEI